MWVAFSGSGGPTAPHFGMMIKMWYSVRVIHVTMVDGWGDTTHVTKMDPVLTALKTQRPGLKC